MDIQLNLNRRIDPLLNDSGLPSQSTASRVMNIALPFLSLHATTGRIASIGMGLCRTYTIVTKESVSANDAFEITKTIGAIALSILFSSLYYGLSQAAGLAQNLWALIHHLKSGNKEESCKDLFLIASQIIHIASFLYGMPELLLGSLLCQALTEFGTSLKNFQQGDFPEMVANALLGCIRIYQAVPHAMTVNRNYFGKALTQQDWEKIYHHISQEKKMHPDKLIDVDACLKEKGISSHIQDIDFTDTDEMTSLFFHRMRLKNCDFSKVSFEKSRFSHVSFNSCLFAKAVWIHSVCQNVFFQDCSLKDAAFVYSQGNHISYNSCDMSQMAFNSSTLTHLVIDRSHMEETSFLFSNVHKAFIQNSELVDVLFCSTRPHFAISKSNEIQTNRPVIGLTWDFRDPRVFTPIIDEAILSNGGIPLRFEFFPEEVDPAALEKEVALGLAEIKKNPNASMLSLPQELLRRNTSEQIALIQAQAEEISRYIDGLALSGGHDVEPAFYGQAQEPYTHPEADMRRTVLEFALLDRAYNNATPTMGTCRGSQMINVFLGGDLTQDVQGQWAGFQDVEWSSSEYTKPWRSLLGEEVLLYSSHHQASRRMGKELEVVLDKDGIPKLFVSRDGQFIGSQGHPEIHVVLKNDIKLLQGKTFSPDEQPIIDSYLQIYKKVIEQNQKIYELFIGKCQK